MQLLSRYEHGSVPITVAGENQYVIERPEGSRIYQTKRETLLDLTGGKGHWSWSQYFRLGKYAPKPSRMETTVTVFDLFPFVMIRPSKVTTTSGDYVLTTDAPKLGIDLAKRGHEVRKLLFAGFGRKIHASGYDPEDVLQEVYKGILVRNNGKCPFNPAKASFGHYVHMVCDCIVSNYHRRMSRQRRVEPLADENDELAMEQAEGLSLTETDDMMAADLAGTVTSGLAARMIPMVRAGYGRSEIAEELGLSKAAVSKALSELRDSARSWAR